MIESHLILISAAPRAFSLSSLLGLNIRPKSANYVKYSTSVSRRISLSLPILSFLFFPLFYVYFLCASFFSFVFFFSFFFFDLDFLDFFGFFWIFRAGRTLVCFRYFVAGPVVKLRLRRPRALGDRALRKKELYVPPSGLAKEILNNTQ